MNTDTPAQVDQYASILFDPAELVEVRTVHGSGGAARTLFFCDAGDLMWRASEMIDANARGFNIYIGLNPRKGPTRGDEHVLHARCLFADRDGDHEQPFEKVIAAAGLPAPTMSVSSGHGEHTYWKLAAPIAPDAWREWQKDLAALLGTDPVVCNPERIARLPGFLNVKRTPHLPCSIMDCDPSRIYDLADLPIPARPGTDAIAPVFTVRQRHEPGVGNCVERCIAYLRKMPNAISGAHGHDATYAAACQCNRFGLTKAEAITAMQWFNVSKCEPAWSEKELQHKVDSAYAKNQAEHGQKLRDDRRRQQRPTFTIRQKRGAAA